MKTSHKSLEEVFRLLDTDDHGVVTNLEFKEAIRKLNIGLTSKDIDCLINYIEPDANQRINWKNFIKKFTQR